MIGTGHGRWLATGLVGLAIFLGCAKERAQPATDQSAGAPPSDTARRARILTAVGGEGSRIEGVAAHQGRLYVADWKDGSIYRVDPGSGTSEKVGALGTAPNEAILGVLTDQQGNFYAAVPDSGLVLRVAAPRLGAADFDPARDVTRFVTGAFGANGLAFDASGHLWITGGDKARLYHVGPKGGAATVFAKDYSPVSSDTTMPVRVYTVNGIGFDSKGNIYTVNTGTGEVSKLTVGSNYRPGTISSFVKDDRLIGADGLIMDAEDNLWIAANYRNALMKVSPAGAITEVSANDQRGPLHFPAELKEVAGTVYLANLNFPIGANSGSTEQRATIAAVRP